MSYCANSVVFSSKCSSGDHLDKPVEIKLFSNWIEFLSSTKLNGLSMGGVLTFDEFKAFIKTVEVPAQRLGIFRLEIKNKRNKYDFHCLKESENYNEDAAGFSLNHYGWLNLPMPKSKRSQFHDEEDVSINIYRDKFIKAIKKVDENKILINTKNWSGILSW